MVKRTIQECTYQYAFEKFILTARFSPCNGTVSLITNQDESYLKTNALQKNYVEAMAKILNRINDDFIVLTEARCYPYYPYEAEIIA